ncbi:zinc finger Y-chromosomal protein-like [Ochlerotatus camptorhynchus]|uniref:zinc finger Y-chromosomal protein-like n=1 Tax=Ochlerotatus camptorhynchus TaxID=644619 RepID=UPI0031D975F5
MDSNDEMEPLVDGSDEEHREEVVETEEAYVPEEPGSSELVLDALTAAEAVLDAAEHLEPATETPAEELESAVDQQESAVEALIEPVAEAYEEQEPYVEASTEPVAELEQEQQSPEAQHLVDDIDFVDEQLFEEIRQDEVNENDGELIGIDREDCDDSNHDYLYQEIEIKEEELDIEPDDDQTVHLDDDPIMGMPFPMKDDYETDEDLVEPMVQIRDGTQRRRHRKHSTSETDTADEGEDCNAPYHIAEHAYHAPPRPKAKPKKVKKKVSKSIPIATSPYMPRNVRGFLSTKNSMHHCLECYGKFFSMVSFLKHRKRHPKQPNFPHQCRYCPTRFRVHRDMMPHLLTHSKLEHLTCPICPTQVHSAFALVNHMQIHKNPAENYYFKCVTCSVRFSSCKQLEEHNLVSHPQYTTENQKLSRTVHVCFHCGKVESTWPELLLHMRIHKGPLACTLCLLSMKTSDSFAEHVVKVHKDMGELTYHRCTNPSCPREFISTRELKQHEKSCLPLGGEYRCEICEQLYRELDHFITHMQLHSMLSNEIGQKMCPHCVLTTKSPADYAEHLVNNHGYRDRIDTLEKVYESYLKTTDSDASAAEEDSDVPEVVQDDENEESSQIDGDVRQECEQRISML